MSSKSHIGLVWPDIKAIAFPTSNPLPPPKAITPSHLFLLYSLTPSSTFSPVGFPVKLKKAEIVGIESRIEQVIANLLENEVSFSPEEKDVVINLTQNKQTFKILIKDSGPGFDEKNLNKVFERFYSDRPNDHDGRHSGLGLNIVKNIVDAHKGSIEVYNDNKKGAVVDINLPSI